MTNLDDLETRLDLLLDQWGISDYQYSTGIHEPDCGLRRYPCDCYARFIEDLQAVFVSQEALEALYRDRERERQLRENAWAARTAVWRAQLARSRT